MNGRAGRRAALAVQLEAWRAIELRPLEDMQRDADALRADSEAER